LADKRGISTRCVHAGELTDIEGATHTPVFNTTTFGFESTADLLDVVEGRRSGNLYTRYGQNPSIRSLENKLASLEGAESALSFSSGIAAESSLFFAHGLAGIVCVGNAYGGTLDLLTSQCPQLGIPTYLLMPDEIDKLEHTLKMNPGLVFFETPTNPTLEIMDITTISKLAHKYGARVAVDSTFASPINQHPLSLGADFVVHSATKYLGGHSDITAGALMASEELIEIIRPWRRNLGQMLAPEVASLLSRSLRTLDLRVRQQNISATAIARVMQDHPKIAKVYYPGLPSSPWYDLAASQMSGFGGMLTLEIVGTGQEAARVVDRLRVFTLAPSLGGVESVVTQPVTTSHHGMARDELHRRGISESMIRLSVGVETPEDLIADLVNALGSL
jgi:cystathionine gamma-synthase